MNSLVGAWQKEKEKTTQLSFVKLGNGYNVEARGENVGQIDYKPDSNGWRCRYRRTSWYAPCYTAAVALMNALYVEETHSGGPAPPPRHNWFNRLLWRIMRGKNSERF